MEPMHFAYTFEYTPETCALIQGIVIRRQRIPVRSIEAVASFYQILRSAMLRWGVVLLLSGLLDYYFYWSGRNVLAIILLVWLVLGFLFSYGGVFYSFLAYRKKLSQFLANENRSGELVFDEEGLTDCGNDGTITKCLWAELDFCVVTDLVIVFFFGNQMIYLNNSAAAEETVREMLTALGKERKFCRRSIQGAFQINKI